MDGKNLWCKTNSHNVAADFLLRKSTKSGAVTKFHRVKLDFFNILCFIE